MISDKEHHYVTVLSNDKRQPISNITGLEGTSFHLEHQSISNMTGRSGRNINLSQEHHSIWNINLSQTSPVGLEGVLTKAQLKLNHYINLSQTSPVWKEINCYCIQVRRSLFKIKGRKGSERGVRCSSSSCATH